MIRIISGTATSVTDRLSDSDTSGLPALKFNTVMIPDGVLWKQIPEILEHIADVLKEAPPKEALRRWFCNDCLI